MKTILSGMLLFALLPLLGQTNFRFADSTAQWNVLETQMGFCNCGWAATYSYTITGDTSINGLSYQRLFCPTQYPTYPMMDERFYVRKDSSQKIYGKVRPDSAEYVLYDFSRQPGDAYSVGFQNGWPSTYNVHVDSVSTVNWNGTRKVQYVTVDAIGAFNDIFVEGIGALRSYFLYPGAAWFAVDGPMFELLCFSENSQVLYHDTAFQTCVYDTVWGGIHEPIEAIVKVSPNPVMDTKIIVEADENFPPNTVFQLMDLSGKMILRKPLLDKTTQIKLSEISIGLYLYSISSGEQKLASGKLVIQ